MEILDFDLRATLEDIIEIMAVDIRSKGLEITCLIEPDVPALLCGDPGRLRQILVNLINNAVKFTEKGEIIIRAALRLEEEEKVFLRFTVEDTGIGFPRDRMNKLFKSFSQVDTSTTRKYGGTGLGFVISKQLSEMMGGEIGVESEEGKGSTFWFTANFGKQPKDQDADIAAPEGMSAKRILLVDHNETNRKVCIGQLETLNCYLDEASSGHDALEKLSRAVAEDKPFDIAIVNMQMAEMNGEALGRRIKKNPEIKDTRLIMVTSGGQRGDSARMKKVGFSAYLTKPLKRSQLYDAIVQVSNLGTERHIGPSQTIVTKHSVADANKRKIRILVAEDNMINQQVALNILDKFGYRADAVANGQEAVQALEMIPYDLVLMDVQMPEMDGLKATRMIRNPDTAVMHHDIPIIAMTAHAVKGYREKCLESGMDDYTTKPIDPKELLDKIENWTQYRTDMDG